MKQLTEEQAIEFANSEAWKTMSNYDLAIFQLSQQLLCIPFSKFHESVEEALDRPVFTHEFADTKSLMKELLKEKEPPSLEQIISKLPSDKTILIKL